MSNGNGHHWSKFFWRDWSADKALHPCSLAAKGFWIEMLCIMHEGTPVGHLTLGGKPASIRQMAANAYCTEKEATKYLAELEEAGVFSRTDNGTIFCRRMVKDAAASEAGREYVARRWNGQEPNSPPNTPPNREPNRPPTRIPITKNLEAESESEKGGTCERVESQNPRARARALSRIPPEWEPNGQSTTKAIRLGLNHNEINLIAEQMRAWAKAGDQRRADWDAMFDRFVLQEFSSRAAERRRAKTPSAAAEIRAAVGSFLTVDLEDDDQLPASSMAVLQ